MSNLYSTRKHLCQYGNIDEKRTVVCLSREGKTVVLVEADVLVEREGGNQKNMTVVLVPTNGNRPTTLELGKADIKTAYSFLDPKYAIVQEGETGPTGVIICTSMCLHVYDLGSDVHRVLGWNEEKYGRMNFGYLPCQQEVICREPGDDSLVKKNIQSGRESTLVLRDGVGTVTPRMAHGFSICDVIVCEGDDIAVVHKGHHNFTVISWYKFEGPNGPNPSYLMKRQWQGSYCSVVYSSVLNALVAVVVEEKTVPVTGGVIRLYKPLLLMTEDYLFYIDESPMLGLQRDRHRVAAGSYPTIIGATANPYGGPAKLYTSVVDIEGAHMIHVYTLFGTTAQFRMDGNLVLPRGIRRIKGGGIITEGDGQSMILAHEEDGGQQTRLTKIVLD